MAGQLNIQEIKNSGILELYVAGALTEEESKRIHLMVREHDDLLNEVRSIEEALMKMSSSFVQQKPRVNTVYQVLNTIEEEIEKESGQENKIVDFLDKKEKREVRWLQIAAAIALILSIGANLFLYSRLTDTEEKYLALQNDVEQIQESNQILRTSNEAQSDFIALINVESSQRIQLQPQKSESSFKASVVYDEKTQSIGMSQWDLASLSEEEVYQLWAIYGKEVVSLGVLPKSAGSFYFNTIEGKPDAFAISFEPNGESETPTDVIMVGAV